MTLFTEQVDFPANFSGRVRLFPLPNLVVFPHVMQPLHIFEPRYRELLEQALDDDQLISMAVLEPGWESDYDGRPPISKVVCIGRILTHSPTQGGYNILLLGLRRARITRELPPQKAFRQAEVEVMDDHYPANGAEFRRTIQEQLLRVFRSLVPQTPVIQEQFARYLDKPIPLGMLTDILGYALSLSVPRKQRLLSEGNVDRRARLLAGYLSGDAGRRPFPPDFSMN